MVITRKRGSKMAKAKFDVLKSKDMSKVKKDIKDIKKNLRGKTVVKGKNSLKLIPKNDVKAVKKDIRDIKKTLSKKLKIKKPKVRAKPAKFGNYYDILPHRKIERLEDEVMSLKGKLKGTRRKAARKTARKTSVGKGKDAKSLERSMNKLSASINNLMRLFEVAGKERAELAVEEQPVVAAPASVSPPVGSISSQIGEDIAKAMVDLRDKISELSMENEEMAKGILVVAEMLKEALPEKRGEPEQELPPEGIPMKSETFAAFGGEEKKDELQLPPLESMPDTYPSRQAGAQKEQESKKDFL